MCCNEDVAVSDIHVRRVIHPNILLDPKRGQILSGHKRLLVKFAYRGNLMHTL